MSRWLIGSGPLGVRHAGGQPTRPVADFVSAMAAALVAQGDPTTLLFSERAPNAFEVEWLAAHHVEWRYWGPGRPTTLRHALALRRALHDINPDAVVFEFGGVSLGIPLAWAHRVPLRIARCLTAMAAMRHDGQTVSRAKVLRRRLVYRCATHVAVNARPLIDEVVETYKFPKDRILLQLQGVHAPSQRSTNHGARRREIVCIGRLARTKGQHVLIAALGELRARGMSPRVHFVGGGEVSDMEQLAISVGVESQCVFHGPRSRAEVYDLLTQCAIAVQPSLSDALPQSVQEAVVCGAVVVASDVGGIPDVVRHDVSGLLVPPAQPGALADALGRLLGDDVLLARLAVGAEAQARRIVMETRAPAEAARLRRLLAANATASARLMEIPQ